MPARSAAARGPIPVAGHCWPTSLQETLKHSKAGLTQSLWGLWVLVCTRLCLSPPASLADMKFVILPFLPSYLGFSFALGHGILFFGGIQHYPVNGCLAATCNFRILAGEDERMSFYSTILNRWSFQKPLILIHQRAERMKTTITENQPNGSHGPRPCLTQWNYEPCQTEVGGGIRMWNTCKSMADSSQCMAKTTTIL